MIALVREQLKPALIMLVLFTLLTGGLYPLSLTIIAQLIFPVQANGSIIKRDGEAIGSRLIGQPFDDAAYFWGRPSATKPYPYNAGASSGSNLGPTSAYLKRQVEVRIQRLQAADPDNGLPIPADLVTASGSGLDPHISVAAATYQIARVARARGISEALIAQLVTEHTEPPAFGWLGEPRVNVLLLNLALDELTDEG